MSVEHTLETLRIMKTLFDDTSLQGDTSVCESFMAGVMEKRLQEDPNLKIILLVHNNRINSDWQSVAL